MMAKWELVKLIRTLTGDRKSLSVHVDNESPLEVQLKGRIVAKSTDPKPPGQNGDILIWWDTKQVWLHDGTDWREW